MVEEILSGLQSVPQSENRKPLVLCLMGPTASGKTALAMALREVLPVELISVDSALVYRGLDIGSAKPTAEELAVAPHRLIDICDPAQPYSAADFREDALREIAAVHAGRRVPLLVGGTMLYFRALLQGLADMPAADSSIRARIEADAAAHGWPCVHRQLAEVDPEAAAEIHPNHSQRISRALEVYLAGGKTMTQLRADQDREGQRLDKRFNVVQIGLLAHSRALLHRRIEVRFRRMLEQGFLREVEGLYRRGDLHPDLPALRAVGYRQAWEYLAGECDHEVMIERGIAATRQLAKRQLTWLRGWPGLKPLYIDSVAGEPRQKMDLVREIISYLPQTSL